MILAIAAGALAGTVFGFVLLRLIEMWIGEWINRK
jgi:hypothetical protein